MSLLEEIITELTALEIPAEVGLFKATPAPEQFCVLTPLNNRFECSDDRPDQDLQAVRVSLFSKTSYTATARAITEALIEAEIVVTDRRYIGHEDDTGYHHYVIDVEKNYTWED